MNTFSILAIVFGGIAFLFFPIVFGPAGIIMAGIAFSKKEPLAPVGMVVGVLGTLVGMFLGFLVADTLL